MKRSGSSRGGPFHVPIFIDGSSSRASAVLDPDRVEVFVSLTLDSERAALRPVPQGIRWGLKHSRSSSDQAAQAAIMDDPLADPNAPQRAGPGLWIQ